MSKSSEPAARVANQIIDYCQSVFGHGLAAVHIAKLIDREFGWLIPQEIEQHPESHSTSMKVIHLLVCVDHYDHAVRGWFNPAIGWRIDGSPSAWDVKSWMPLPKKWEA